VIDSYDTIVVGGGTAGCILAARLSEDGRRLALVEAGIDTPPGDVPADVRDAFPVSYSNPRYFWPNLGAAGLVGGANKPFPQARIMGGGSSVMGMWALRGMPADYDSWRAGGALGWGWDDVLPTFNRIENDLDCQGPLHGQDGPVSIRRNSVEQWPGFARAFLEAACRRSLPYREDINGDFRDGVYPVPLFNDAYGRVSSASAYLTPNVRARLNLDILSALEVTRISMEARSVTGVEVRSGLLTRTIRCREVILAAGAIGSPAILLRSGIGPAEELRALGIQPVVDLPGVGKGLQNHCIVNFGMRISPPARQGKALRTYGLACLRASSGYAPSGSPAGDLHIQCIAKTSAYSHGDRIGIIGAALYAPLSRGSLKLQSANPDVASRINFCLLDHPADRARLAQAVVLALELAHDPAMRGIAGETFVVGSSSAVRRLNRPSVLNRLAAAALAAALDGPTPVRDWVLRRVGVHVDDDEHLPRQAPELLDYAAPVFHPAGTCAMGRAQNPLAVVDPHCRVRGVHGLRVADASVMPSLPRANTCLPTMMIGEHAAALVLSSCSNQQSS
jgi:5-(hydroxymethyl)furfural/furfural oxidase